MISASLAIEWLVGFALFLGVGVMLIGSGFHP